MLHRSVMLSPPLLSSRLPPLTPRPTFRISSQHVNAHQETPSSHYSTVFHWHAVPSSSPHHTRRLSCYCYGNSFFFLYFVIPILLHFFFSSLFILFSIWLSGLGRKQRSVWNFDGHLPIQPSCTLLCFSCIISTRQKGCTSRSGRCLYIM